jgi:hypothetical protein
VLPPNSEMGSRDADDDSIGADPDTVAAVDEKYLLGLSTVLVGRFRPWDDKRFSTDWLCRLEVIWKEVESPVCWDSD